MCCCRWKNFSFEGRFLLLNLWQEFSVSKTGQFQRPTITNDFHPKHNTSTCIFMPQPGLGPLGSANFANACGNPASPFRRGWIVFSGNLVSYMFLASLTRRMQGLDFKVFWCKFLNALVIYSGCVNASVCVIVTVESLENLELKWFRITVYFSEVVACKFQFLIELIENQIFLYRSFVRLRTCSWVCKTFLQRTMVSCKEFRHYMFLLSWIIWRFFNFSAFLKHVLRNIKLEHCQWMNIIEHIRANQCC